MTMEAAREAVRSFTSKIGHHTDVDEVVNAAVTREVIKPHRHEETTEAIDREVHQHHYHTTVQPISHKETLPERHSHVMLPIDNREFHHGDHDAVKRGVSAEIAQFASTSVTHDTHHTRAAAPAVTGEHVHHHVHETVQPVIYKETVQPEIVHTTVPIHEVHHAEATHHGMSALPMKTLDEFTRAGGILHGSERHSHEEYTGAPRPYNKDLLTTADKVLNGITGHHKTGHTTALGQRDSLEQREALGQRESLGQRNTLGQRDGLGQRDTLGHREIPGHHTHTNTTTTTTTKHHTKRDSGVGSIESANGVNAY